MALRPYQREGLKAVLRDYRAGVRRLLMVMATAAGKTMVVSRIPELIKMPKGEQLLFIVNRDDLVEQAAETYRVCNPNLRVGIERGDDHSDPGLDDVIIGSIQSMSRKDGVDTRMLKFNPERITVGIIDETHFALSAQFIWLLRYLRMLKGENPDDAKLLLGITATPDRTDGRGLEAIYDKITFEVGAQELMQTGPIVNGDMYSYLARPKGYRVQTDYDMSMVRVRGGNFVDQDLGVVFDKPEYNQLILDKYEELGEGFPGAMFATSVKHAHAFAEMSNARGIPCAAIDGSTTRKQRDWTYAAYAAGDIKLLSSMDVLTYGFDMPPATVALMARPVKSSLLYRQMVGRFFRRFPSVEQMMSGGDFPWVKPYSIIVDFCGLLGHHSMVTIPSLFGLPSNFDFKGKDAIETKEEIQLTLKKFPMIKMTATSLQEFRSQVDSVDVMQPPTVRPDVQKFSKFAWLEIFEGILQLGTKEFILEVKQNTLGLYEIYESRGGIRNAIGSAENLKTALLIGDARVPADQHALQKTRARWRADPPSEKQCMSIFRNDPRVKQKFSDKDAFFAYAMQQHRAGNVNYSKGGLSRALDQFHITRNQEAVTK